MSYVKEISEYVSPIAAQEVGGNMLSFINEHEYIMITECIHENVFYFWLWLT